MHISGSDPQTLDRQDGFVALVLIDLNSRVCMNGGLVRRQGQLMKIDEWICNQTHIQRTLARQAARYVSSPVDDKHLNTMPRFIP